MNDNISSYNMLIAFAYCWGFAWGYMFKQAKQIENRTAFLNYCSKYLIFAYSRHFYHHSLYVNSIHIIPLVTSVV